VTWLPYDEAVRIVRSKRRRDVVRRMKRALPSMPDAEVERLARKRKRMPYEKPIVVQLVRDLDFATKLTAAEIATLRADFDIATGLQWALDQDWFRYRS
jgi:hypothetical protein